MARLAALTLAALLAPLATSAQQLSPAEEIGRRIYHDGADGAGRPIVARVAGSASPLRGKPMACGNCHGEDGRGRPESGVDPGDVTWAVLTKPYGHAHANGRRHGPYDARSFKRAMRDGADPAGNVMEPAMPLYEMTDADLDGLIAYLRRLESQVDPGLSAGSVRVGTLLPLTGPLAETGRAVRVVLEGYFAQVNRRGGVHGRTLELVVDPAVDDPAKARAALHALVERRGVFALVAPLSARVERELVEAVERAQVPVVGPLTLFPESAADPSHSVFHLMSGVPELAEVLATRLQPMLALGGRPVVLLHADTDAGRATAAAVEARLKERGYGSLQRQALLPPEALAKRLKDGEAHAVFVLTGGASVAATARALAAQGSAPYWLLPAPFVPPDVLEWPAVLNGRLVLAYPSLPGDRTAEGLGLLKSVAGAEAARNPAMQVSALAAAMVFVEGMSRAGREVSRRKLIAALEELQNFDTGLTPKIRFSTGRRIGAYGGYVVEVDLERKVFRPSPDFIRLQ